MVRLVATQADFWPAVDTKLEHAFYFYVQMTRVFDRDRSAYVGYSSASPTITITNWQTRLFANLDAFLAMTRSVPDIIQASFGWDRVLEAWLKTLGPNEQKRRQDFAAQFKPTLEAFKQLPLSRARNSTLHRRGETGTEVTIITWFGVSYSGSALKRIPSTVTRPVPDGVDPATLAPGFSQPIAVEPMWQDFTFEGRLLFDEIRSYRDEADKLRADAWRIAQAVHGTQALTDPPN